MLYLSYMWLHELVVEGEGITAYRPQQVAALPLWGQQQHAAWNTIVTLSDWD